MKYFLAIILFGIFITTVKSQELADTTTLKDVKVKGYFVSKPLISATASVAIINSQTLGKFTPGSLLPAMNTAPGVRMEERSPGSYRLSIRGSLLRSPFGIRNVKIYMDDFLLTDAGGNTYLNILDASSIGRIEIIKGPEGSVFGANSGGVVLIDSKHFSADSSVYSVGVSAGSFGIMHQDASLQLKKANFELNASQAFQKTKGYRDNSEMNKKSFMVMPSWQYSRTSAVRSLFMFSDLQYQTPGGLTLIQSEQNPKAARSIAVEQKAAIYNKTFFSGISHEHVFNDQLRHVISLTGSVTDFRNPFITNYEVRKENSFGLRSYVELLSAKERSKSWNWQLGLETQKTSTDIKNFDNNKGQKAATQSSDKLSAQQSFLFTHFSLQETSRLNIETSASLNYYRYSFRGLYPVETEKAAKDFKIQLLPRIAFSYRLANNLFLRSSISKGYSAPTIAEVRPADKVINTNLQPETGWNYESGLRFSFLNNRLYADGSVFHYRLKNTIVRRVNSSDSEFFTNAGATRQNGVELQLSAFIIPHREFGLIRGLKASESYTGSDFRFDNYIVTATNFSGNRLTGVPAHNLVSSADLEFLARISVYLQHSYVSAVPLNDANSVYSAKYHLLQSKISWQVGKFRLFTGADNLLNAKYSLGNDLNAFGGRYFNPAPTRNFYGGVNAIFR